jgi:hypothetical protein
MQVQPSVAARRAMPGGGRSSAEVVTAGGADADKRFLYTHHFPSGSAKLASFWRKCVRGEAGGRTRVPFVNANIKSPCVQQAKARAALVDALQAAEAALREQGAAALNNGSRQLLAEVVRMPAAACYAAAWGRGTAPILEALAPEAAASARWRTCGSPTPGKAHVAKCAMACAGNWWLCSQL